MELGRKEQTIDLSVFNTLGLCLCGGSGYIRAGSYFSYFYILVGTKCINVSMEGPHKNSKTSLCMRV